MEHEGRKKLADTLNDCIKREDALRAFNGSYSTVDADDILRHLHKSIDVIKNIPSADVRKNVHAQKVIGGGERYGSTSWFECSHCRGTVDLRDMFCKHCGTDMRGD